MNKKLKVYKIKFLSPLHIYSGGFGFEKTESIIHSDTLYSAVCSSVLKLYGQSASDEFISNDKTLISSAFPFYNDIYFFPKPLNYHKEFEKYVSIKKFKKVKYLPVNVFSDILNNGKESSITDDSLKNNLIQGCFFDKMPEKKPKIFETYEVPRIAVDRVSNSTLIFYFSEIIFGDKAGLFFIADFLDDKSEKIFDSALSLLGDEGIGADNTVGKGLFKYVKSDLLIDMPDNTGYVLNLSLYSPDEKDNINFNNSFYNFTVRGGWVSAGKFMSLRRKSVRMITEGSVLSVNEGEKISGRIVNVLDKNSFPIDYNIFRYGKSFNLPVKLL